MGPAEGPCCCCSPSRCVPACGCAALLCCASLHSDFSSPFSHKLSSRNAAGESRGLPAAAEDRLPPSTVARLSCAGWAHCWETVAHSLSAALTFWRGWHFLPAPSLQLQVQAWENQCSADSQAPNLCGDVSLEAEVQD